MMNKDCSLAKAVQNGGAVHRRDIHNIPVFIDIHLQFCSLRSHAALFLPHSLKCCDNLAHKAIGNQKYNTLFSEVNEGRTDHYCCCCERLNVGKMGA